MILGARVLGEFGDDPNRYANAKSRKNYAGTSPITRASGTDRVVLARYARNKRLADASYLWAFAALTASPGARTFYDQRRAAGDTHHQPSAPSPTASSASSTAASPTTPPTTNTPPGDTAPTTSPPLDTYGRGMSSRVGGGTSAWSAAHPPTLNDLPAVHLWRPRRSPFDCSDAHCELSGRADEYSGKVQQPVRT